MTEIIAYPTNEVTQSIRASVAAQDSCYNVRVTTNMGYRVQLSDPFDIVAAHDGWPMVWVEHYQLWNRLSIASVHQLCQRLKINWQQTAEQVWRWDGGE